MRWVTPIVLTLLMVSSTARAEDTASAEDRPPADAPQWGTLREVPRGVTLRPRDDRDRPTVFRPAEEYKCFTTPEWVQLGAIVVDYRWFFQYSGNLELKLQAREGEVAALVARAREQAQLTALQERRAEFNARLFEQEHALRLSDGAAQGTRERLLWIGGGVLLAIDVLLAVVLIAQ